MMRKRTSALAEQFTLEKEQMRKEFVFKVFFLLSCQLFYILLTLLVITSVDKFKLLFQEYSSFMYIFFGVAGVIYLLLLLNKDLRRKRLVNLISISLLVVFLALGMSAYVCYYHSYVCVFTVGIQYAVVIFVTVLAKFGPCDVAGCSMICCVIGVVCCIFGIVASLIILLAGFRTITLVISGLSVAIITVYLMFDTQAMLENKKLKIAPSEFVRGNIHLYVDVILIFVMLLKAGIKLLKSKLKRRTNKT